MLRVEVEQDIALQLALGQLVGTKHARLLVASDEGVDGTVLQGLVLHDGHDRGHAETIISTKRGALCLHPFAVNPRLDGVGLEVVLRLGCLLRHHVHVGLQDDALAVLHSRRSGFAHVDVSGRIFHGIHAAFLAEVEQELLDFLQMSARTRHLCQFVEVAPDTFRLKVLNFVHVSFRF